jgi:membrane protease subunit HflK
MRTIGDAIARGILTMAGRKSPWGGGKTGDHGGNADSGAPEGSPGDADSSEGPPETSPEKARGPRNPWLPPSSGETPPRRSASIEDIFRARDRKPGGGGGGNGFPRLPQRPDGKSWLPIVVAVVALMWLFLTTAHMVGPKEEGIVSTFGRYSRTIEPGVSMTLPWPIQTVDVVDVTSIKLDSIPDNEAEKLMLTSDQNLVDLSYLVRWSIKDLKLYTYQLSDPEQTVREVAEAAMRASIAEVNLSDALGGAGRATVEQNVRTRMQEILDTYRSGVLVQGVEIKKADPPDKVKGAFQQVTAAQQDAQRDLSNAEAQAQQLTARAQAEAQSFDKVYEQYKLAPEVTKRRMYYETMERVLSNNDKVVVESGGVTPYLPLPELRRRAQASSDQTVTAPAAPASPTGGQ